MMSQRQNYADMGQSKIGPLQSAKISLVKRLRPTDESTFETLQADRRLENVKSEVRHD